MKNKTFLSAALAFFMLAGFNQTVQATTPLMPSEEIVSKCKVAPTPPMGWNSFDAYDCRINEQEFKAIVDYMATNLKQHGWEYAVIDYCWFNDNPGGWNNPSKRYGHPDIRLDKDGKPLDVLCMDEYSRLIPSVKRFPSAANGKGFKPLADYVHSKGMKFGIHIMRGMPWIAAENKQVIKGTDITCDQVAEENDQCLWYGSMYGIDCTKEGAQAYYDSLIELYTSWDVDFIKADDMGTWDGEGLNSPLRTDELEALAASIEKFGNKIVLSVSPGAAYIGNAYHLSRHAHMWRISCDFWDNWDALKRQFPRCAAWSKRKVAGHWPDADMLPMGKIGIRGEVGEARNTNFTYDEQITLMSLWCIFRSPLMFGGDLPQTDTTTLNLITNKEAIELNQHSKNNKQIYADEEMIVWTADHENDDKQYIALFNLGETAVDRAKTEPFVQDMLPALDVWNNKLIERGNEITIVPHGTLLLVKENSK